MANLEEENPLKRKRSESKDEEGSSSLALTTSVHKHSSLILRPEKLDRSSSLPSSELTFSGHDGSVLSIDFDPSGNYLASASTDNTILLWDVFGSLGNFNQLRGHKNAVLDVKWNQSSTLLSCSADKTLGVWDTNQGKRIRNLNVHKAIVNSCDMSKTSKLFVSGSDDCSAVVFDQNTKSSCINLYHDYQVTAVAFSDDDNYVYTGGIDNIIRRFDLRMPNDPDALFVGHEDTIASLSVSPTGTRLLSNGMDNSIRVWDLLDISSTSTKLLKNGKKNNYTYDFSIHNLYKNNNEKNLLKCSWSFDENFISCGNSECYIKLFNIDLIPTDTGINSVNYLNPTDNNNKNIWSCHSGVIHKVTFHPSEFIYASCSSDSTIIVGEYMP